MAGFDPQSPLWFFRCGIWRLNVSAQAQRQGVGRFAVESVFEEARSRGFDRASVMWLQGAAGPENFYLRLGFLPTGERFHDQVVGAIDL
jgi:diamine N-acetyltransferase